MAPDHGTDEPPPSPVPPAAGDGVRDRYVTVLLNAFERSLVTPDEYTYRLGLLDAATTEAEMRRIVQEMVIVGMAPSRRPDGPPPPRPVPVPEQLPPADLDALERAFLAQAGPRRPARKNRWAALVVVAVIFLALLVMGVVLAATVHPASSSSGGTVSAWFG